jgi:hypothetical protein
MDDRESHCEYCGKTIEPGDPRVSLGPSHDFEYSSWSHYSCLPILSSTLSSTREARPVKNDRDHIVEIHPSNVAKLRDWLQSPNGACIFKGVIFEAVVGGGVLVRTSPYRFIPVDRC